jgi:SAM-dependent methyltransferase
MGQDAPTYLVPYLSAAERHAGGFRSLLWASASTQAARFDAFTRLLDFTDTSVLDVGCGRADLPDYLLQHGIRLESYIGLEAVPLLAETAEQRAIADSRIIRADFVAEPSHMFVGADIVVFSGSLNTLADEAFYVTLRHAFAAAGRHLIFNFLSSAILAGTRYLYWRHRAEVKRFLEQLGADVRQLDDYIDGDCSMLASKALEIADPNALLEDFRRMSS